MGLVKNILTILVIILVIYLLYKYLYPHNEISSLKSAQKAETISASDLPGGNSNNNFAYSVWIYIKNWNHRLGEKKVILQRGGNANGGGNPSITLGKYENDINVELSTYGPNGHDSKPFSCSVQNIPLQRWVNAIVSLNGRSLDIYIDGKLVRTCILPGVARADNTANVFITPSGGFSGWTGRMKFWPHPLNPQEAFNVYREGTGTSGTNFFNKYRIKFSYLVDNVEKGSFEI